MSPRGPSEAVVNRLLAVAVAAATTAGRHALRNGRRRGESVARFAHDVKLKLDHECQERAERVIRRAYPDHAILGEESTGPRQTSASGFEWVIDPIDGTVNFSHGQPFWCCAIAACYRGQTVAAAVFAPALNELYTATSHAPARCNGQLLRVSPVARLDHALVMSGLDKSMDPRLPPFEVFRTLSAHTQKTRIAGCAALDICRVARGQADGYFESGIYIWDVAAAGLIAERAGGRGEILQRQDGGRLCFLASNGHIHRPLRALVTGVIGAAARRHPARARRRYGFTFLEVMIAMAVLTITTTHLVRAQLGILRALESTRTVEQERLLAERVMTATYLEQSVQPIAEENAGWTLTLQPAGSDEATAGWQELRMEPTARKSLARRIYFRPRDVSSKI